jgi:chemotaxis regulatin CheY-phosphate phosphatase CheZ
MSTLPQLTDEDYFVIEDAIAANARGRAFLRLRDQRSRVIATDEVKRMMRSLTTNVKKSAVPEKDGTAHIRILRQELQEMSVYIQQTRSEVAALRPDDSGNNRIMAATGELDAIVTATERATSDILNSAENILALVGRMPRTPETTPLCQELEAQATEILTTCSFQDITGQRTTKVVNTLHYLEKRVNSMIEIWGTDGVTALPVDDDMVDKRPDAHLLNGPSSNGVSQDDVDAMLANMNSTAPADAAPSARPAAAAPPPAPKAKAPAPPAAPAPVAAAAPVAVKAAAVAAPAPVAAKAKPPEPNGAIANGAAFNQNEVDALFD